MTTVAAYCICKNEEANILRLLDTLSQFDQIVVVDTGSTDRSVQILRDAGIEVVERQFVPFDFGAARNVALNLVRPDIDWCLWIDFNEILSNFSKEKLENVPRNVTALVPHRFDNNNGVITPGHQEFARFHRNRSYRWVYSIHEVLTPLDGIVDNQQRVEIDITKFIKNTPQKLDFYQTLCEQALEKDPNEPHYMWFLTSYYHDKEMWTQLLDMCYRYILNTSAYCVDFRVIVWCRFARAAFELRRPDTALMAASAAFAETLHFPRERAHAINLFIMLGQSLQSQEIYQYGMLLKDVYLNPQNVAK